MLLSDSCKTKLRQFPSFTILHMMAYFLNSSIWPLYLEYLNPLAMLRPNASLNAALSLLVEVEVSSIPIVDDNDSLQDIYCHSDVTALEKDRVYVQIHLDELSVRQVRSKFSGKIYVIAESHLSELPVEKTKKGTPNGAVNESQNSNSNTKSTSGKGKDLATYEVLEKFSGGSLVGKCWWKLYCCSVSNDAAFTRGYFCMQVSKHMNHLLKAPFRIHSKTGRICVLIDPKNCEEFDPIVVPTLSKLLEELNMESSRNGRDNGYCGRKTATSLS